MMLGFYTLQNFNRWKDVRNVEGSIIATVNDLALRIAWSLRDPMQSDEPEAREAGTVR